MSHLINGSKLAMGLLFVFAVILLPVAFAQTQPPPSRPLNVSPTPVTLVSPTPSQSPNLGGPGAFNPQNTPSLSVVVQRVYNLAMMLAGIIAFGAVVYGAFMYTFSAGNPGMQSDARDQIFQAFLGLALLLGSYLILNTINPEITKIVLAPIPQIKPSETQLGITGSNTGGCGAFYCKDFEICVNKACVRRGLTITCNPACDTSTQVCVVAGDGKSASCQLKPPGPTGCDPINPKSCPAKQSCVLSDIKTNKWTCK